MLRRLPTMPKLVKRGLLIGSGIYLYNHSTFNRNTSEYKFETPKGLQVLASPQGFYIQRSYSSWLPPFRIMSIDENGFLLTAKHKNSLYVMAIDEEGLKTDKLTMDPDLYADLKYLKNLFSEVKKKSFKENNPQDNPVQPTIPSIFTIEPLRVTVNAPADAKISVTKEGLFAKKIEVDSVKNEKYLFGLMTDQSKSHDEIIVPAFKKVVRGSSAGGK